MRKPIANFHYLTQDLSHYTHDGQVRIACEAGVKWIQLRVKNKSFDDWLKIGKSARQITNEFNVTLIINDNVNIAKEINADGVHLGQEDTSWRDARKILGEGKIIGYSTHSLEDLIAARNFNVDYFGLGPYRFTTTKENLHDVLALDKMKQIIQQAQVAGIIKPIIAIGGIQMNDAEELLRAGANGIAVSSAINLSQDPARAAKEFLGQLQTLNLSDEALAQSDFKSKTILNETSHHRG
jgi:thiamine-phosphate pyrophosphorylase